MIDDVTVRAFTDEIEKISGIGSFISKGVKALKLAPHTSLKQHGAAVSNLWRGGSKALGSTGNPKGFLGGAKALWKSPYGHAAGTAALGGTAAYGGYKMMAGDGGRRRRAGSSF
jgi:hypothetical protein